MTTPITFDLDSSDYNAKLGFDVLLNNNVVFTTEHVTEPTTGTIDISDDEGEYELKFVLKNKALDGHPFFGNMGCNGYVSLKFATPIYLWLLEHM